MKKPSNELVIQITNNLINNLVSFARANGYDDNFVMRCLFAATGTFGMNTDRGMFFHSMNDFIKVTRQLYPEFTFEDDPYAGRYLKMIEEEALREKQNKTVH